MIAPCIICANPLDGNGHYIFGSDPDFNQPDGGTGFITYGHHGSTAFDPMNGNTLSISVCDDCLKKAARAGRVLLGRDWKPVMAVMPGMKHPEQVGSVRATRSLTVWDPDAGIENDDEALEVDAEDVGVAENVNWNPSVRAARSSGSVTR